MKETLEEAAERLYNENKLESDTPFERSAFKLGLELGSKWQSERMYSEYEVLELIISCPFEYAGNIKSWFHNLKK